MYITFLILWLVPGAADVNKVSMSMVVCGKTLVFVCSR